MLRSRSLFGRYDHGSPSLLMSFGLLPIQLPYAAPDQTTPISDGLRIWEEDGLDLQVEQTRDRKCKGQAGIVLASFDGVHGLT